MMDGTFGGMLADWRRARRMSQLDLALDAGISARHLSFVETGRARPSRDTVLTLCSALRIPPRDRNSLLLAAGFAPVYRETALDDPQMAPVLATLVLILRRQEPFPAVVLDRNWDIVMANRSYSRIVAAALPEGQAMPAPFELAAAPRPNLLRLLCGPAGLRPLLRNWEAVVRAVLARVRREIAGDRDPKRRLLLESVQREAGMAARHPASEASVDLVIPVELGPAERPLRLLSTIATLGTAQDITLQDLRIELFYPADADTDRAMHEADAPDGTGPETPPPPPGRDRDTPGVAGGAAGGETGA